MISLYLEALILKSTYDHCVSHIMNPKMGKLLLYGHLSSSTVVILRR